MIRPIPHTRRLPEGKRAQRQWLTDEIVNILVVDDLPEKLLVYETILERLGQNVVTAARDARRCGISSSASSP